MNYSTSNNIKRRKDYKSKGKKISNKVNLIIFRVLIIALIICGFATVGAALGAYTGIIENAPKLEPLAMKPSIYPSIIYYDDGVTESARLKGEENREYVTFDKIPQNLKDAFVAIEDERFYSHNGVDVQGIGRAIYKNFTVNSKEGASTITQQLIKNNVLKIGRNTVVTKLQEQYLAVEYEKHLLEQYGTMQQVKDYILELYLNSINMHYSLNGVQTASDYYFSKPVSDLTLSECAVIAAITQNPANNNPISNPEKNKLRQTAILDKMLELDMISSQEHIDALEDDVYARVSTGAKVAAEKNSVLSYYNDALLEQVVADLRDKYTMGREEAFHWVYNGGMSIMGVQNKKMQDIMDDSFLNDDFFPASDFEIDVQYDAVIKNSATGATRDLHKRGTVKKEDEVDGLVEGFKNESLGANDTIIDERTITIPQPQAAMVVMDYHNGRIKALTGGRGNKQISLALNRAVDSTRQPGSVFKILASYAPSIDLGVSTAATVIEDAPFEYQGWSPRNWYGGYHGYKTVRDGIRDSMNVVTVKNMINTGIDECFQYLLNFGFTTLVEREEINGKIYSDVGAPTCLGGLTHGVTQVEVTAAYAVIANQGVYNKPVLYTQVLDQDGYVLLDNIPEPRQVLKKQTAYILTDMMEDVITGGGLATGRKAQFSHVKMPISGKTGTTTDTKDLTFVGYTPYYVAGIWQGYDYSKTIKEDKGYHLKLWSNVMEKIHEDLPNKEFDMPDGIVRISICGVSGKRAVSGLCENDSRGNPVRTELFMAGTQGSEDYCVLHVSATIDASTNMKAGSYCPSENVKTVVGILQSSPSDEQENLEGSEYEIPLAWIEGPECTLHDPENLDNQPPPFYVDPDDGTIHYLPSPNSDGVTDIPVTTEPPQNFELAIPNTQSIPEHEYTPYPAETFAPPLIIEPDYSQSDLPAIDET